MGTNYVVSIPIRFNYNYLSTEVGTYKMYVSIPIRFNYNTLAFVLYLTRSCFNSNKVQL